MRPPRIKAERSSSSYAPLRCGLVTVYVDGTIASELMPSPVAYRFEREGQHRAPGRFRAEPSYIVAEGLVMPHRPEVHRWYSTSGWQRRRAHQLRLAPLCAPCLEAGRVTPATIADHIQPHRGDYAAFRLGPLRSLCKTCHDNLDRASHPRFPVNADGTPSDPDHWWKRAPSKHLE